MKASFYLHLLYVKSGKTALVLLLGCSNTAFISIFICLDPLLLHRNPGVTVWTGSPHCQGLNLLHSMHACTREEAPTRRESLLHIATPSGSKQPHTTMTPTMHGGAICKFPHRARWKQRCQLLELQERQ